MLKNKTVQVITMLAVANLISCASHTNKLNDLDFISNSNKTWLAGDHHIHGKYSAKWNWDSQPPTPILFGDAHYFTALNAQMAEFHGLDWMVTTDHGGPNHSKVNLEQAYPELVASRQAIPGILQFYGMEFDMPSARHATLIIPQNESESQQLYTIESQFNRREIYPDESSRDTDEFLNKALTAMQAMSPKPILSINHPARKAPGLGQYEKITPQKMRQWQDIAPDVITGMTAIPGHQAATLNPDGSIDKMGIRAEYYGYPTHGGADQMSAIVGGVWDSFLGEGRRWSVTAVSDSHAHFTEERTDFWPGEYAKTYVYAEKSYPSVFAGLRSGNVFITTGDLINELFVTIKQGDEVANIGEQLQLDNSKTSIVTIAFKTPKKANFNQDIVKVARVDLIFGQVHNNKQYIENNTNPTTRVIKRFDSNDWQQVGDYQVMHYTLPANLGDSYIRVRGTNLANELEPQVDPKGENPWSDLWFYSNPIYLRSL